MRCKSQRGVALTEYAILLAFIAAIAVSFTSNGLGKSIAGAVDKVVAVFDMNRGSGNLLAGNVATQKGAFVNGDINSDYKRKLAITGLDDQLFSLKPNTPYEITVDLTKLQELSGMTDADMAHMQLGLFAWGTNTSGSTPWLDSGDMSFATGNPVGNRNYAVQGTPYGHDFTITPTLSADGKTMTYSFTSGNADSYAALSLNFHGVLDEQAKMNAVAPKIDDIISLHQAK